MIFKTTKELNEYCAKLDDKRCLLSFSTGKDAICIWLELQKYFEKIIPVYYYLVPELSFIEASLRYYEDVFKTEIIRVPNPNLYRMLNNGVYQTPGTWKVIKRLKLPNFNYDEIFNYVKQDFAAPETPTAIGNRMYDNLNRYGAI